MTNATSRITGIDIARGLAVLGMFAAHLGHEVNGRPTPTWLVVVDGRSAATFAVLAGLSVALFTGRRTPPSGPALRNARWRVVSRAAVILVIGAFLSALGTPVAVILPSYAVTFLLLVPALRAPPVVAAYLAAVAAVVGPLLVALATTAPPGEPNWLLRTLGTDSGLILDLFLTGYYPAVVWIAYMLLGLAVGRLDLGALRVQLALGATGVVLALVGYLGSDALLAALGPNASPLALRLARAEPHDDSTLELVGNSGVALAVLAACLLVTTAPATARVARVVLDPLASTGAMALSVYSFHIVAIAILGNDVVWRTESNAVLGWFIVVTLVLATAWRHWLGRGPLERLMRAVSVGAVTPSGTPAAPQGSAVPRP
ncbi:heparan-alpha-glucosaminide N-acetyltransferase domain-containing protein [Georgenia faecalis]|uniref:Heparan-alpha-glucosaminide N-acetyltransferase domain-containing protein n=1 Tax=Georgenia faecalis TaxID=2483799 RepID=A0ABV9DAL8_9MICO|nr:heparan-alpha-glucosaminide N-acetyltransferase domain-containing protein [Georgenia faecalis]